jgi:putative ABC transport system substrate-binding protein
VPLLRGRETLEAAIEHRIAASRKPFGLMAYAARRAELQGRQAERLPVLQPTKFDLVTNLKTAKALGLEIRVAVIRDPAVAGGAGQLGAIQSVAPSFGVELSPVGVRDPDEIERGITAIARSSNGGLIVTSTTQATVHRTLIIALATRHKLPTVYSDRVFVIDGGLISYGPDRVDSYRRAAGYVDRILKGEKPADLPVQAPTKYGLVINLKTAKTLGIDIPPTLLARADEVIE